MNTNNTNLKSNPNPNKNRIPRKANRNLYEDQIVFLSITRKKLGLKSDSELLRIIVDRYIDERKASDLKEEEEKSAKEILANLIIEEKPLEVTP